MALCFLCHAVQNNRNRTKAMAAPPYKASANAPKGMQTRTRKRQNTAKRKAESGFSPRHWPWTAGQKTANRIAKHRLSRHGSMSFFAQTNTRTTYNAHFLTFTFAHFLRQFFRQKTVCRQKTPLQKAKGKHNESQKAKNISLWQKGKPSLSHSLTTYECNSCSFFVNLQKQILLKINTTLLNTN